MMIMVVVKIMMIMSVMRENAPAFVASPRVVVLFALRCHPARPTYANAKIINIQIVKYTHLRSVRYRNRVLCVYNRRYNFSPKKENFGEQKNNRKSSREIKTNKTQFRERRMKGERGKKRKLFTEKSSLFLQVPIFCDDDNCPHPIPPSLLPLRPPQTLTSVERAGLKGRSVANSFPRRLLQQASSLPPRPISAAALRFRKHATRCNSAEAYLRQRAVGTAWPLGPCLYPPSIVSPWHH